MQPGKCCEEGEQEEEGGEGEAEVLTAGGQAAREEAEWMRQRHAKWRVSGGEEALPGCAAAAEEERRWRSCGHCSVVSWRLAP